VIAALMGAAWAAPVTVDVRDREDGDRIAGAVVRLDEPLAETDRRGLATAELPGAGPWSLTVLADGYRPARIELTPPVDEVVRVWMVPGADAYEVVVEGLKVTADPTRHAVDGEMALETPGTLDDSVRLVQSLPGVAVQREYSPSSGDLSVRGSSPGDNRYFLDGVEVPYLYHFNQYASVFPATQVGRLELFPSTFSARYGDAVGAVVEATSRLERPEAVHGGGSVNFVMGSADVSAPLGERWWFSASGRRSYQDLAGEQTAQYTVWPTFHDFAVRAEQGDADDGVGIFALGAGDRYTRAAGEIDLLDPVEADSVPYLAYQQGFQLVGVRRQWRDDAGTAGRVVAAVVHHQRASDLSGLGGERLDTLGLKSRLDASAPARGGVGWDVGYELNLDRVALRVDDAGAVGVRVAEEAPALARWASSGGPTPGVSLDDRLWRLREAAYGTARIELGGVAVMPGLRVSADSAAPEAQIDPRATVRWALGDRAMLKAGGGRYAQRPDSELLFFDRDLPTTASWQVSAGWEQAIGGRFEVGLDLYGKWLYDPLVLQIDGPPEVAERGEAVGAELTTRYRLRELLFLWGWLAVQQTTLRTAEGTVVPGDGDQRVSGGIVVSWDVGRVTFGARYRYASGLPFTQIEGSIYDGSSDSWVPVPGAINGARLPAYHKVDARMAYGWAFRGWSMEAVLELWVVPRASAQLYPTWNYDYSEQGWVVGPTVLPLAGVRARF
jgi:hypothetical protein